MISMLPDEYPAIGKLADQVVVYITFFNCPSVFSKSVPDLSLDSIAELLVRFVTLDNIYCFI